MKPRLQLFGYWSDTLAFENRWGKLFVRHEIYAGGDFNLSCLFETFRRLRFLPLEGNYSACQDGMVWTGLSSNFGIIPENTIPPEYEIKWEESIGEIDGDNTISIECYYRKINFSYPFKWVLLPNEEN